MKSSSIKLIVLWVLLAAVALGGCIYLPKPVLALIGCWQLGAWVSDVFIWAKAKLKW